MFHVEQTQFIGELVAGSSILGIQLHPDQALSCFIYCRELLRWNAKVNLTSIREEKEIVIKHFVDSFACSKALALRNQDTLLDVGSGAGFPGLPLRLLRPELSVTLLEPNEKKVSFLRHIVGTLDLKQVTVVPKKLGDFVGAKKEPGRFSHVITRALAATEILPFADSLLEPGGRLILCRTKPCNFDPTPYGLVVSSEPEYELPHGYGHRVLTVLQQAVRN